MVAQNYTWPAISASASPSVGPTGSPAPTSADEVAGVDGGGILRALSTDTTGKLNVNISSSVLPTGGATAANQVLEIAAINQVDSDLLAFKNANHTDLLQINTTLGSPFQAGGSIGNTQFGATQVGTWNINNISGTISLPTGASTLAAQTTGNTSLSSIDGKLNSLGQKTMAASMPVVIASDQSAIPISGSVTVSGTVAATQSGTWSVRTQDGAGNALTSTGSALDVNLKTSSITLPISGTVTANAGTGTFTVAGTVTANAGTNLNTSALALDTSVNGILVSQGSTTLGEKGPLIQGAVTTAAPAYTTAQTSPLSLTTAGALRVDASGSTQPVSGTVAVTQSTSPWVNNISQFGGSNVVTGTGASGAGIPRVTISNDSSLAANQSVNMNQVGGSSVTLGSKTSANSIPVVIASDQASIPVAATDAGNTPLQFVRNDYTSTNVTTAAYVQLIASTSGIANVFEIFDSSGQTLKIAFGAAASEVDQFLVFPGGNGKITCKCAAGTRISIRAVSATASVGELDLNLYT